MPKPPLPPQIVEMLARPNPAVIGMVHPEGGPVTVPTWYLFEGGKFLVNMDAERKRVAWLRADPNVALTVMDEQDWYSHVSIQGTMSLSDDPDLADIDRIARHYSGTPYPNRDRPRINGWIEVSSWHAWGKLRR